MTTIGDEVFLNCTNLEIVQLPSSIQQIGVGVFKNCKGLKQAALYEGMTTIPDETFYECTKLQSVGNMEQVIEIGAVAFYDCNAMRFTLPETIEVIKEKAFAGCNGEGMEVHLVKLKDIGAYALPDNLTKISMPVAMMQVKEAFSYMTRTQFNFIGTKDQVEDFKKGKKDMMRYGIADHNILFNGLLIKLDEAQNTDEEQEDTIKDTAQAASMGYQLFIRNVMHWNAVCSKKKKSS